MAWTSPMTAVANTAFTAAQFNTHVRDNLNETAPAKATAAGRFFVATGVNAIAERELANDFISTNESTSSTTYTDLATPGPSVTVTTSTRAIVFITCQMSNGTLSAGNYVSYAISGATTVAASDDQALINEANANDDFNGSSVQYHTGLTPGSNVFTAKYKVNSGNGTFRRRRLIVMPF